MQYYQNLNFDIRSSILNNPKILFLHDKLNLSSLSAFHWSLTIEDLHPNFLEIISKTNLTINLVEAFKTNPNNNTWPIHIDVVEGVVLNDLPKLNCIFGSVQSPMIWYKEKNKKLKTKKTTPTGTEYLEFAIDELEEVARTNIEKTSLVQAGVPHTVINTSNKSRYCVSIIFKKNKEYISFNELKEELKDYVV